MQKNLCCVVSPSLLGVTRTTAKQVFYTSSTTWKALHDILKEIIEVALARRLKKHGAAGSASLRNRGQSFAAARIEVSSCEESAWHLLLNS
jgi:hypothetical protein